MKARSQGPFTFGTMITSSLSPISATSSVMSSRNQGLSSELIRVQSWAWLKSWLLPTSIRPRRASVFLSAGIESSRLPSRMSTSCTIRGTRSRSLALLGSKK